MILYSIEKSSRVLSFLFGVEGELASAGIKDGVQYA